MFSVWCNFNFVHMICTLFFIFNCMFKIVLFMTSYNIVLTRRYTQTKVEEFKFLTRLHYWAADTVTHGKKR